MLEEKIIISGREFTKEEIEDAIYVVEMFSSFSRLELAKTICEGIQWCTPSGKPKSDAGLKLLNYLEKEYKIMLPPKKDGNGKKQKASKIELTNETLPQEEISGNLSKYLPINLEVVRTKNSRKIWNEYIERYHIEKYKRPFGSHLKYFIMSEDKTLGCILFSASAWALESRDKWIGWKKEDRMQRLHLIINNTRFLLFPWVKVKYLASHVLGRAVKQISKDWMKYYNYEPVLLETFVDIKRYKGICYKAANWQHIGETKGRGRQDRYGQKLSSPKDIYMYPLKKDFRKYLTGEKEMITGGDLNEC